MGYVSPTLIGRYRTFDSYDDYLLSFIYNTAPEKYRYVFVFAPYQKTINAADADEERPTLPIYLDFNNLLQSIDVEELSDKLATALRPYGANELDIHAVNPIGTNWFTEEEYGLLSKYFIEQDITEETFVATDVDASISGDLYSISSGSIKISGSLPYP